MPTIRPAGEADIPILQKLYRQLALNPDDHDFESSAEGALQAFHEIKAVPDYHLLVAEEEGAVVGTATLVVLPGIARKARRWAVIEYVVVDEKHRSKGIGQALMEYMAEMAREAGCYDVMLSSNKLRKDAHRFYERLGYRASHEAFHKFPE